MLMTSRAAVLAVGLASVSLGVVVLAERPGASAAAPGVGQLPALAEVDGFDFGPAVAFEEEHFGMTAETAVSAVPSRLGLARSWLKSAAADQHDLDQPVHVVEVSGTFGIWRGAPTRSVLLTGKSVTMVIDDATGNVIIANMRGAAPDLTSLGRPTLLRGS